MQKVKQMKKRILISLSITALPFSMALGLLINSGYPAPYKIAACFISCVLFSSFLGWYAGNVESGQKESHRHA